MKVLRYALDSPPSERGSYPPIAFAIAHLAREWIYDQATNARIRYELTVMSASRILPRARCCDKSVLARFVDPLRAPLLSSKMSTISPRDRLAQLAVKRAFQAIQDRLNIPVARTDIPSDGEPKKGPARKYKMEPPILPHMAEEKLPIGIIGAGCAGLCAAMMLQDLGIDYEILEALPDEEHGGRTGGRIYTYRFNGEEGVNAPINDPKRYDYIDMGAMRYPKIPSQEPTFRR